MIRLLNLLFIAMILCANSALAQDKPLPFSKGETISYVIKKFGIKAGTATLTFHGLTPIEGKSLILIVFEADGFNFYDEEKIYVDPENYTPVLVFRDLNIFGKKEKIKEEYLTHEGRIKITKTAGDNKKSIEYIEKAGTLDNIYAVIYRYRQSGSFQLNDEVKLRLPTQDIKLIIQESVKISTAGKKYDAFYVTSVPSKFQIWFDSSEQKIPLRINGAVGMANTTMLMQKYQKGNDAASAANP